MVVEHYEITAIFEPTGVMFSFLCEQKSPIIKFQNTQSKNKIKNHKHRERERENVRVREEQLEGEEERNQN